MADISKITLPNNSQYDIKVYTDHIAPMMSKTFTGVIGTANNWTDATFFFGKILPNDFNCIWRITYRITAECAGRDDAKSIHICTASGRANNILTYANWNNIVSTSYRPLYYNVYYRAKAAGITNGYGHLLGTRLYSAWNATTSANSRTIQIDILKVQNCTFEFFNSPIKYSNAPGTGSTNYDGASEYNISDNGLQETGDANTVQQFQYSYKFVQAGTNKIYPYTVILQKPDGKYESTVLSNSNAATGKSANTSGFIPGELLWYNAGSVIAADAYTTSGIYHGYSGWVFDYRYSFNGISTTASASKFVAKKSIYLVGTITNGLFYLDTTDWLAVDLPTTDDGKVYVYLGCCYDAYRGDWSLTHPIFYYKNGTVQLYNNAITVNGHTVESNVPANAKFTDTTYDDATTSAHGLMTAAMVTKLNGIATGAEVNQNAYSNVTVGSTTISADAKTDTLTLVAGSNVTLTPDATNDKITIAATDTTYESKAAASGGTAVSLVTTGEKYTWNSKTSNTGTVTKVSTGVGLTGGDITTTGTVKAKLKSETASTLASAAMGTTANRQYAVGVDKDGYLSVNVPWAADTDTNVTNTLNNTAKAYLTGTTTATTNTGTQVFDNGVYVTTTAGQLNATTYKVNEKVTLQYDTTADCLNFVFS